MDEISRIAGEHRIAVVEDNAHGLFATYRGRWLGRFGQLATLSFHETKNFSCGEGGALVVNDERLVERAEIIREKGTNRSRFLRGEVDKYTWMDIGSSYVLSDMLAAFLLGQLEARDAIQHRRRLIFKQYESELTNWARPHGVRTLQAPEYCDQPHHMFYLRFPNREARDTMIDALRASGILAVSHYVPLHLSAMGRRWGYREGSLPVTEAVCGQVLRLPFFTSLPKVDQQKVVDAVLATDCPTVASGIPRA
jgi:dTDP-4-amino-4,6-dideoxygalactose transaminase